MTMGSKNYPPPSRTMLAETRTPSNEQGLSEEEIAAVIAAILAGHFMAATPGGSPVAAITRLLRPSIDLPGAAGDSIADGVARLAVTGVPKRPAASQNSDFALLAYVDHLVFRAHYAVVAMRRIVASVETEEDVPPQKRLEAPMTREAAHFGRHQDGMRRRVASLTMVEAAVERWGPVLGWRLGHSTAPRTSHIDADEQNFDTRRGIQVALSFCRLRRVWQISA